MAAGSVGERQKLRIYDSKGRSRFKCRSRSSLGRRACRTCEWRNRRLRRRPLGSPRGAVAGPCAGAISIFAGGDRRRPAVDRKPSRTRLDLAGPMGTAAAIRGERKAHDEFAPLADAFAENLDRTSVHLNKCVDQLQADPQTAARESANARSDCANSSKTRGSISFVMPMPLSRTRTMANPSCCSAVSAIRPP